MATAFVEDLLAHCAVEIWWFGYGDIYCGRERRLTLYVSHILDSRDVQSIYRIVGFRAHDYSRSQPRSRNIYLVNNGSGNVGLAGILSIRGCEEGGFRHHDFEGIEFWCSRIVITIDYAYAHG